MSYCKVAYCRFSSTHVTKGHKCGRCGIYGHGDAECNQEADMSILENYKDDVLPLDKQCLVNDCETKELHCTNAHHCPLCQKRDPHTKTDCTRNIKKVKCPMCRTDNVIKNLTKIKGLSDKCCVCLDNTVEILFPECSHCCVCFQCFSQIR